MIDPQWLLLALGVVGLAFLGLMLWGERRAARYWDAMDARVAKLREECERTKPAG